MFTAYVCIVYIIYDHWSVIKQKKKKIIERCCVTLKIDQQMRSIHERTVLNCIREAYAALIPFICQWNEKCFYIFSAYAIKFHSNALAEPEKCRREKTVIDFWRHICARDFSKGGNLLLQI